LGLKARLWSLTAINLVQTIQQSATIILVIAGVYAINQGNLTVGGLIACTILTGRALAPMTQIATIMSRYQHARAAFGSIDKIMQLPGERDFKHHFLERRELETMLEFKNVSFTYPGQSLPALNQIDFKIGAGEKVAIIGPTGSGKSTLQRLISKLYLPSEGSLLIGNTDVHQIDPADLRKRMSYLPQEPTLLAGTVRDNIRLGFPTATDEQLLEAASFGGIRSYFDRHPQGFDFQIGERGAFLSGGQRQGIAIARALLNRAPMLLLDEPSNAMDQQMEQHLIDRLSKYAAHRTLILVTHRLNLLQLVDRVIVMNEGRIVADDAKHKILEQLANTDGQAS
jgi:ATP-binding cassette, subfamily C, bacterial LapB